MTNTKKAAEQPELPFGQIISTDPAHMSVPGVVGEVSQAEAARLGAFEEDAISEQDALESVLIPAEHDPFSPPEGWADEGERRLAYLRDAHRVLSEQIVAANRALALLAKPGNLDSSEVRDARDRLSALSAQRSGLDAVIAAELKARKAEQRALSRGGDPQQRPGQPPSGLVKIRHPNRDFFLADLFDYALKDDGASMEAPIFTLSTKPDHSVWEWRSQDGNRHVKVVPSVLGRATMHDKDILIYCCSQMVEGLNRGREDAKSRTIRFTVYDLLVATNRQTSGEGYKLLQEAFERLRGTSITTDIRTGGERVKQGFGIIDEWRIIERAPTDERMVAVEVTLSRWLFNAVQAFEVLTIHPDYFRLRKPLARRLYELARKHCGRQQQWMIGLELLQAKTGSKSTLKEFRRAVRAIAADSSLPEYRLILNDSDMVTFLAKDPKRALPLSVDA